MTTPAPSTPPRLPVPDAWHVALTYDVSGQPAVVVLGYANASAGVQDITGMTNFATNFHNAARGLMATSCTLTQIAASDAGGSGVTYSLALPATNRTGIAAGNLITGYATLLKWGSTFRGGRSGKGRTFVPGFVTGSVNADGRTLSSTAVTAANSLVTAMIAEPRFAIISHRQGAAYRITSGSVASIVGVQRRRLRN